MKTSFLQKEYLTLALIKAKNDFFHENFVTTAELNQFIRFIQQHFINQKLDIVVTSNNLSKEDFNIVGDIIKLSDNCAYNLDRIPTNIASIITNQNLIAEFFISLEREKLNKLENIQTEKPKSYIKKNLKVINDTL